MKYIPTILISEKFDGSVVIEPNDSHLEGNEVFLSLLEKLEYDEDSNVMAINAYGQVCDRLFNENNDPNLNVVSLVVARRDFDDYYYDWLMNQKNVTLNIVQNEK